jgi:hypothetical protein
MGLVQGMAVGFGTGFSINLVTPCGNSFARPFSGYSAAILYQLRQVQRDHALVCKPVAADA